MAIMMLVWPLIGLAGGPFAVWLYRRHKRPGPKPAWLSVAVAACHCGAGCTLGDLIAECAVMAAPSLLFWFGLGTVWHDRIFAAWSLDFLVAFLIGIVFQFFAIAPMRGLRVADGLFAALKADSLSLLSWQVGMYGFMAVVQFVFARLTADRIEFWSAMQLAMLAGFAMAYPVNAWLIRTGIKEKMS